MTMPEGITATLQMLSGHYKGYILLLLYDRGEIRFNALQREVPGIAFKTLSANLRQMQADGLVVRQTRPQQVCYALTEKGRSLAQLLLPLAQWGMVHAPAHVSEEGGDVT